MKYKKKIKCISRHHDFLTHKPKLEFKASSGNKTVYRYLNKNRKKKRILFGLEEKKSYKVTTYGK